MKRILLSLLLLLLCITGFSKTWTVTNTGTKFSPATTTITFGDTVKFVLESSHNAEEVSQSTWNANGNTTLPGGFETNFGGGTVLPAQLAVGTHYFVCDPHASLGMKGTIVVNSSNGIPENMFESAVSIFPNPAVDLITVKGDLTSGVPYSISDGTGRQVLAGKLENEETTIYVSELAVGTYFFQAKGREKKSFSVIKH